VCQNGEFCCNSTCGDSCDCSADCNGVLGGGILVDDCGICGGFNQDQDVCGVCFGFNATLDRCGVCFGDGLSCCGDGILQQGEDCDPLLNPTADCCDFATCQFSNPSVVCRASTDLCDKAEFCTGFSLPCPPDSLYPNGTTCRPSAGPCDKEERCDEVSPSCPVDEFYPSTRVCEAGIDNLCDLDSFCTGTNVSCPPKTQLPDGTTCDLDSDVCTSDTCFNSTCITGGTPCFSNCSHGELCSSPGTTPVCTNLSSSNFPGCDGFPASGLVPDRCGVCGGDGSSCVSIPCTLDSECPTSMSCCGGFCANKNTSEQHCGACGNGMSSSQSCSKCENIICVVLKSVNG
jgi:hypothetical protein